MLGIRRTLDIFHKTKEAISIKIYNQWHLGVVSVAVPESIAEGIPLTAGGGRERQIWRLHWQGNGWQWSGLLQRLAGNATSLSHDFPWKQNILGNPEVSVGCQQIWLWKTGCPGQAPMLSGNCWSLREPAIYLPWSQQARARSAPNQQLGHPNGDERVYDWVWMVTAFLLGGAGWTTLDWFEHWLTHPSSCWKFQVVLCCCRSFQLGHAAFGIRFSRDWEPSLAELAKICQASGNHGFSMFEPSIVHDSPAVSFTKVWDAANGVESAACALLFFLQLFSKSLVLDFEAEHVWLDRWIYELHIWNLTAAPS